ncbi:fungal-specific transcription factor domain-containing protein [Lasiosphaeris hirsuta]|uniref:Fungal-specific transcription factor domain-containing protein n=1 Tax=Lasiosphaeris hirsuta TaxID=260670 RepID=A0AA40AG29_9PEZI|nr:fungal-specific transcription factor domain-containing protein [Lasiosphaeris hirsuta]
MPRGSSFSDNPLLRVSRPVSACSRCRGAKVKCDGKLPACTACEKAGRETECSAANDQFARGKERSYVAALELRIEKLEKKLAYARSRKASVGMHDGDASGPPISEEGRKDSLADIRDAIRRKAARRRENSDVNALVSDFGYLSVNATTRDFEPEVTNMTFARLVLAASANDPIPEPKSTKLPAKDDAYQIIDFYLTNVHSLYPAFPDTSLTALRDELYQDVSRPVRHPESWMFWMVLAIGSMAQSRSADDGHYQKGLEFVARAMRHADRALMPGYITQLQSLLLLTQYSMLDPAHFDSWHLIGFTCRAVIDLGLHQDPPQVHLSDEALEARRRTFYCIYSLDRAISMVHARAFSFTDDSVSVALPAPISTTPPSGPGPSSPDPSVYLFKLRCLQSSWYQTLFQSDPLDPLPDPTLFIWERCLEMRRWSEALPPNLPVAIREMLDLELRYSYVYCIAPSSRAPHMTSYGRILIFEHAIAYIHRIYDVAIAPENTAFYTYHDALRVYFMGSQFVAVLHDAADEMLGPSYAPGELMLVGPPGKAAPPPIPKRLDGGFGSNLDRSLRTLGLVRLTLKRYGEKYEYAQSLMGSFEERSAEVLASLEARKQAMDAIGANKQDLPPARTALPQHLPQEHQHYQHHQQQHQQQQQQQQQQGQQQQHQQGQQGYQQHHLHHQQQHQQQHQQHQQAPQEVTWVDADLEQMMRSGRQV